MEASSWRLEHLTLRSSIELWVKSVSLPISWSLLRGLKTKAQFWYGTLKTAVVFMWAHCVFMSFALLSYFSAQLRTIIYYVNIGWYETKVFMQKWRGYHWDVSGPEISNVPVFTISPVLYLNYGYSYWLYAVSPKLLIIFWG